MPKNRARTVELLCITDSLGSEDQGGSKFAEVFMQQPILPILMSYLGSEDATRLSQAIRYCSFTSTLSRIILFGYGAGKIPRPLKSSYEGTLDKMRLHIETKEIEIADASGLELANPFTSEPSNLQIAKVIAHSCVKLDEKSRHKVLIGKLKSGIKFFFSADYSYTDDQAILIFSKKWEELLKHDKSQLEDLSTWLQLSDQLNNAISAKVNPDYPAGPLIIFDHERMAYLLGRALSGINQS